MRKSSGTRLAGTLSAAILLLTATDASAGEFQVATCQADGLSYSTRAFEDFATRGMQIRRACNPEGPGLRGLITANVLRRGRVPRGAVALVAITAPPGTRLTTLRWAGTARRRDCRYALQLFADGPAVKPIAIKNVRANRRCPRPARAQAAGYRARTYKIPGATRIVQRVICVGNRERRSCSARGLNYIRTYKASVGIVDALPPTVAILPDTPLARGAWVSGSQPLNYSASDNVGVRLAQAFVAGLQRGTDDRVCVETAGAYADRIPCPSGAGQVSIQTNGVVEGSQDLAIRAIDAAGNPGISAPVTARIDNTPPARIDVSLEGGEAWRSANDWAVSWTNAAEADRAPIAAAHYKLCAAGSFTCSRHTFAAPGVSRLPVVVPSPGEWTLSVWRRDAAGNEAEDNASVPVILRYDPEPPRLAFELPAASDPTLVAVRVTDEVSGLAGGSIEISRAGSGVWRTLATQRATGRLLARIDDAALPAGSYVLRARAYDQARNEGSTDRRLDGQPMVFTLPLRVSAKLQAGFEQTRLVKRVVRRHGKRRTVRRRVTVVRPVASVELGQRAVITGRLATTDRQRIGGAPIRVLSSVTGAPEQVASVVTTGRDGRFRYVAAGTSNRTLRLHYGGSSLILPAQRRLSMRVPAATSLRVDRRRVLNGQRVTFRGRVRGGSIPALGKLVEVQVLLSGHWQTFRTTRSDAGGRWSSRYRFRRTRGVLRYRFRARLPKEAGYPFDAGVSHPLIVEVRGR